MSQHHHQQQHTFSSSDPANTFRFLLTTDNHLGFMDRDPVRKDDSFISFEECLQFGRNKHNADAVLLCGDLFHDNKPSIPTMTHAMSLFRKYCFGDKDIEFEILSDATAAFKNEQIPDMYSLEGVANFQDPNINVAMPVFIINGNHDDPMNGYSSLDLLQAAGLVNYFGRVEDIDKIELTPILMKKGNTYVALYGMGNVRDERLHRCLKFGKVTFKRPRTNVGPNGEEVQWFSILLLHQNRGYRYANSTNGIEEKDFRNSGIDLIIWGNEHEQIIQPVAIETSTGRRAQNNNNNNNNNMNDDAPTWQSSIDIIQPGSSVHTAIPHAVDKPPAPKACGILEISSCLPGHERGKPRYQVIQHNLCAVRPLQTKAIILNEVVFSRRDPKKIIERPLRFSSDAEREQYNQEIAAGRPLPKNKEDVETFLHRVAEGMIDTAVQSFYDTCPEEIRSSLPKKFHFPLIRISVDFAGKDENDASYPDVQLIRIGNDFGGFCANAGDMFKKITATEKAYLAKRRAALRAPLQENLNEDGSEFDFAGLINNSNGGNGAGGIRTGDIRDKIASFLHVNSGIQCSVIPEMKIAEAVYNFAEKGEKKAIEEVIEEMVTGSRNVIYSEHYKKVHAQEKSVIDLRQREEGGRTNNGVNEDILEFCKNIIGNENADISKDDVKLQAGKFKITQHELMHNINIGNIVIQRDENGQVVPNNNNNNNRNRKNNINNNNNNNMMMLNDDYADTNNNNNHAPPTSTRDLLDTTFNKIHDNDASEGVSGTTGGARVAAPKRSTRRDRNDRPVGQDNANNDDDDDAMPYEPLTADQQGQQDDNSNSNNNNQSSTVTPATTTGRGRGGRAGGGTTSTRTTARAGGRTTTARIQQQTTQDSQQGLDTVSSNMGGGVMDKWGKK